MLVNAVIYTFPADKADEAAGILVRLATASRTEPGCRRFDVARGNDDPRIFVLFEEWDDQAALDAHYETELFQTLGVNGIRVMAESRVGHKCRSLLD